MDVLNLNNLLHCKLSIETKQLPYNIEAAGCWEEISRRVEGKGTGILGNKIKILKLWWGKNISCMELYTPLELSKVYHLNLIIHPDQINMAVFQGTRYQNNTVMYDYSHVS